MQVTPQKVDGDLNDRDRVEDEKEEEEKVVEGEDEKEEDVTE